jgi:FMN phosphatase YigB (HAD superfamily)
VITTVLIDLDDTLLDNKLSRFLPVYLKKLGAHLAEYADPERVINEVLAGSKAMVENLDPTTRLAQVFADCFYPTLRVSEEDLRPALHDFYTQIFPSLHTLTHPIPAAQQLIETAFEAGREVVIATSPLFPRIAMEHRLEWAGIPVDRYPYSLVTSYEDFHFSKPNLAYYAEILGRLGKPAHEAVMIGNDPKDDLEPAQGMGIPVFHVSTQPLDSYPGGTLEDAITWLAHAEEKLAPKRVAQPTVLLALLRGYLAAFLAQVEDLPADVWDRRPAEGEWAVNEIICHVRDVENEVFYPRVEAITTHHEPHLSAFDTDQWALERDYLHQSGPEALQAFTQARMRTISYLETCDQEIWARPARHAIFGPTTLAELVAINTDHDLLHLAQVRSTKNTILPA